MSKYFIFVYVITIILSIYIQYGVQKTGKIGQFIFWVYFISFSIDKINIELNDKNKESCLLLSFVSFIILEMCFP